MREDGEEDVDLGELQGRGAHRSSGRKLPGQLATTRKAARAVPKRHRRGRVPGAGKDGQTLGLVPAHATARNKFSSRDQVLSGPAKRVGADFDVVAKGTELHRFENRLPNSKIQVRFAPGGAFEPSAEANYSRSDPKGTARAQARAARCVAGAAWQLSCTDQGLSVLCGPCLKFSASSLAPVGQ